MILAIIIFVGIPLVVALIAHFAYNLFFPIKKINAQAARYDNESIGLPRSPATIENLRNHRQIGDKIVFTHHLVEIVKEYRKNVVRSIIKTLVVEFILIFVLALGAQGSKPSIDFWQNIYLLAQEWKLQYFLPIGMVGLCIELFFKFSFLSEQISNYLKE